MWSICMRNHLPSNAVSIARRRIRHAPFLFSSSSSQQKAATESVTLDNASDAAAAAAATLKTAIPHPPRPLFPWRHEPTPLPRLLPGTAEFRQAPPVYSLGPFGRRLAAFWYLGNCNVATAFWGYRNYEQTYLADGTAYAFGQAVAGIVSNVYRIPFADTQWRDGKIQIRIDPTVKEEEESAQSKNTTTTTVVTAATKATPTRKIRKLSSSSPWKRLEIKAKNKLTKKNRTFKHSTNKPWLYSVSRSSHGLQRRFPSKQKQNLAAKLKKGKSATTRATVSNADSDEREKSTTTTKAKIEVDSADAVSPGPHGLYCSNIKDMVSPDLKELYESAHRSGKNQLLVHLDMEPIHAQVLFLTTIPFASRRLVKEHPDRMYPYIAALHQQRGMVQQIGSVQSVLQSVEELVQENDGKSETTIEMQVWVDCNESFHVTDRVTGAVLQGAKGETQRVGHLVRLECTAVHEMQGDTLTASVSDWVITNIDDLLGPESWYHPPRATTGGTPTASR